MRTKLFVMTLVTLVALGACKKKQDNDRPVLSMQPEQVSSDSTVYGKCVDAAMHSLAIVNDKGDTLFYSLVDANDQQTYVKGGIFLGDKLAVIAQENEDGAVAKKVINLTTLLGKWTSIDRNFDIKEGGVVESHVTAESRPYTDWKIVNGRLVLSADTFEVLDLGPDSLYLENDTVIYAFKRQV